MSATLDRIRTNKMTAREQAIQDRADSIIIEREAKMRADGASYRGTNVISWDDLLVHDVDWIVDGVVPRAGLMAICARPNLGKTFLLVDLMCNIALGRPWVGKDTRRVKVVYVFGEGKAGLGKRFEAWCEANGVPMSEIQPWISLVDGANLSNDVSLERISEQVQATGAELVVFDTYASTSGTQNEDDNAMTSLLLNRARSAVGDAAIVFTHHPTKSSEDTVAPILRGAGAFNGAADAVFTMFVDKDYESEAIVSGEYIAISSEHRHAGKNRNAPNETIRGLYVGGAGDSAALFRDDSEQFSKGDLEIRKYLKDGMTRAEFVAASGINDKTAARYLRASTIVRSEPDGRTYRYYFDLAA